MKRVKGLFDERGIMNPGKILDWAHKDPGRFD